MKKRITNTRASAVVLTAVVWLLAPAHGQACTVCAGAAGETATNAAGHAILFMLGVVFVVLGGIVAVVITMQRRARKFEASTAADAFLTPNHKASEV